MCSDRWGPTGLVYARVAVSRVSRLGESPESRRVSFRISQRPSHRKKVFDKPPASLARLAHRIIWKGAVVSTEDGAEVAAA